MEAKHSGGWGPFVRTEHYWRGRKEEELAMDTRRRNSVILNTWKYLEEMEACIDIRPEGGDHVNKASNPT